MSTIFCLRRTSLLNEEMLFQYKVDVLCVHKHLFAIFAPLLTEENTQVYLRVFYYQIACFAVFFVWLVVSLSPEQKKSFWFSQNTLFNPSISPHKNYLELPKHLFWLHCTTLRSPPNAPYWPNVFSTMNNTFSETWWSRYYNSLQ